MWPNDSTHSPYAAFRSAPGAGARRPSELPQPWEGPPPSYQQATGGMPPAPPVRSALRTMPEHIGNIDTKRIWNRACRNALSTYETGEPLPKVVRNVLQASFEQRLRTNERLAQAISDQRFLEQGSRSNQTLQTIAASGGLLFDDDEIGVYQLEFAQVRVHHYQAKQDRLLNELQMRMAHIRTLAAD